MYQIIHSGIFRGFLILKKKAINACFDENCFIGEVELNKMQPKEIIVDKKWYYPKKDNGCVIKPEMTVPEAQKSLVEDIADNCVNRVTIKSCGNCSEVRVCSELDCYPCSKENDYKYWNEL